MLLLIQSAIVAILLPEDVNMYFRNRSDAGNSFEFLSPNDSQNDKFIQSWKEMIMRQTKSNESYDTLPLNVE